MAEHARDCRHRDTTHHRLIRERMAEVVKTDILDACLTPDTVPQREPAVARPERVARRREHEGAFSPRLSFEDALGLGVERNPPRSHLVVAEGQAIWLPPRRPGCGRSTARSRRPTSSRDRERVPNAASQRLGQPEPALGPAQQNQPAVRQDRNDGGIGGYFLAAHGWKIAREKAIFGHGGRGLFVASREIRSETNF